MLVAQAGYKRAFENQTPGLWTKKTNPFAIPRVNICEFHLVDKEGNFSPLIFDYAVVWAAAKCDFQNRIASFMHRLKQLLPGFSNTGELNIQGKNA